MDLVDYARDELERAGLFDPDSDYHGMIGHAVMELVKVFERQGHSGFSAHFVIRTLERLLRYKPLTPLTGEDNEWVEVATNLWQNKRCSEVFKDARGAYILGDNGEHLVISFPYLP